MRTFAIVLNGCGLCAGLLLALGLFFFVSVVAYDSPPLRILLTLVTTAFALGPPALSMFFALKWPEGALRTLSFVTPSLWSLGALVGVPLSFVLAEAAARP